MRKKIEFRVNVSFESRKKSFSWNFNLNCAKAPHLYIRGWCFELMTTGMLRIENQVMLLRITCTETNGVWKVFFGMLLRCGDSKSLYSSKSRNIIPCIVSNQCSELKSMQRAQTDTESSNQCRKFKWIFRCWTGFNLISGFHSSMSFHFVLIFSHCCHTKNAKIRINSLANIDFMCKKKTGKHICCRLFCRRSYLFMQKKSPFE